MIVVSACLAGVECRYNGQSFAVPQVIEMVRTGQAIPLCPEILADLSIPRVSVEQHKGKIISEDGQDYTNQYKAGAKIAFEIAKLVGCKKAILKSKSPTCGCGMIYDGTFSKTLVAGDGIFCTFLKKEQILVYTENEIL